MVEFTFKNGVVNEDNRTITFGFTLTELGYFNTTQYNGNLKAYLDEIVDKRDGDKILNVITNILRHSYKGNLCFNQFIKRKNFDKVLSFVIENSEEFFGKLLREEECLRVSL